VGVKKLNNFIIAELDSMGHALSYKTPSLVVMRNVARGICSYEGSNKTANGTLSSKDKTWRTSHCDVAVAHRIIVFCLLGNLYKLSIKTLTPKYLNPTP